MFYCYFFDQKKQTSKQIILLNKNPHINFYIFFATIGTILFLIKFPLYRYGYSYIISLYLLILSLFLIKLDKPNLIKISKIIFCLCIVIFLENNFKDITKTLTPIINGLKYILLKII